MLVMQNEYPKMAMATSIKSNKHLRYYLINFISFASQFRKLEQEEKHLAFSVFWSKLFTSQLCIFSLLDGYIYFLS